MRYKQHLQMLFILCKVYRIWAEVTSDIFGYDIPGDNTGECWAISAHPHGDCTLKNTEYKGKTLSWLWENHRELFGNVQGDRFPLLIKIIDAKADLSIQVQMVP